MTCEPNPSAPLESWSLSTPTLESWSGCSDLVSKFPGVGYPRRWPSELLKSDNPNYRPRKEPKRQGSMKAELAGDYCIMYQKGLALLNAIAACTVCIRITLCASLPCKVESSRFTKERISYITAPRGPRHHPRPSNRVIRRSSSHLKFLRSSRLKSLLQGRPGNRPKSVGG